MELSLSRYSGKRVCVACSGGRDSMALLHYLYNHAEQYGIILSALNCDHGMRGEESERDSAFVKDYCLKLGIPLLFFRAGKDLLNESDARAWRVFRCYALAHKNSGEWGDDFNYSVLRFKPEIISSDGKWAGCDCVATAHHMDDNAETVLFNLARGSGLSGMCGIRDDMNGAEWATVHPFVSVSRREIDEYVAQNNIPYVDDSTNFSEGYTRNYIRRNVLPALEKAVPGATRSIYRFSRLAAEDEEYFSRKVKELITKRYPYGHTIALCEEPVIFKRAAISVVERHGRKDYTSEHALALFNLQHAEVGKKFEFLGLVAVKEEGGVTIVDEELYGYEKKGVPWFEIARGNCDNFGGECVVVTPEALLNEELERIKDIITDTEGAPLPLKVLKFDYDAVPEEAVVRTMREGDKFTKFGGGTKNLGDFYTDRKIPVRLRKIIPVVASGSNVLMVCGVEISDGIKITEGTKNVFFSISPDYKKL